jgi:lysine-N-methylase
LPLPTKRLQPSGYHAFRCIGADCEDTCCSGWLVNIDKETYELYQRCDDAEMGPRLRELVTINPASQSGNSYARIGLDGASCPFLERGLCGVQNRLGESFLSITCAKYPRVWNVVDDVLQRSLDLACPEAARLMLLDPGPMAFDQAESSQPDLQPGELCELTTRDATSCKPYAYFREIRAFLLELLQYRAYPIWKRLVILASFCDQLEQLAEAGQNAQVPASIQWFRQAVAGNQLDSAIQQHSAKPVLQLGTVLELIVARITVEYVAPRFLECYQEFKDGIEWTAQSSMEEIGQRYAAAHAREFAPFLERHGHMLEHYLVNYVHRTLFPLGPQKGIGDPHIDHKVETIREHCLLMLVYYGVIQTVLIGQAAFHRTEFGPAHAIRAVQSVAKAFEHNLSFAERALKILDAKGIRNSLSMAILLRN